MGMQAGAVKASDDGPVLSSWLQKRNMKYRKGDVFHQKWANRYVNLNAKRANLSIHQGLSRSAKHILPLTDITTVKELEGWDVDNLNGGFLIRIHGRDQIFIAKDREERERWVTALRHHIAECSSASAMSERSRKSGVAPAAAVVSR